MPDPAGSNFLQYRTKVVALDYQRIDKLEIVMMFSFKTYARSLGLAGLLFVGMNVAGAQQVLGPINPGKANASIARMDHAGLLPPTLVPAPHEELLMTPVGQQKPLRMVATGELTTPASRLGVFVLISELGLNKFGNGEKGAAFFLFSKNFPPLTGSDVFLVPMPGPSPFTNSQIAATIPDFLGPGGKIQSVTVSPIAKRIDGVAPYRTRKQLTQISFQTENSAVFGVAIQFGIISSNPVSFDYLINLTAADGTKMGGVGMTMASVINGRPVLSHAVLFNREAGHILAGTDNVTQEQVDIATWTATDKHTNNIIPLYKLINEL
jgi:hypothetical protein